MMRECCRPPASKLINIDQASKTASEAKQSEDPAKMRSALRSILQSLSADTKHMSMCLNIMYMMEYTEVSLG
jgi:hypothetical protein